MNVLRMIDRWSPYDYRENVYETQIVKEALPHFAKVSPMYPRSLINFLAGGPAAPISALTKGTVQRIVTPDEIAADGCVLLLSMNEGSGDYAYDLSGYGNHGYLGGGVAAYKPLWVPGRYGKALSFDGIDDLVDCGSGESLKTPLDFTYEFSIKLVGFAGDSFIWNLYRSPWGYIRVLGTTDAIGIILYDGTSPTTNLLYGILATGLSDHNLHRIAFIRDTVAGKLRTIKDGVPVGEVVDNLGDLGLGSGGLKIGDKGDWTYYLDGILDEFRIYNRALSDDEAKAHATIG